MSATAIDTFYVKASLPLSSQSCAVCHYYTDAACTQEVFSPMSSSRSTGVFKFVQAAGSDLVLLGAVVKTLGTQPVMTASNFAPAAAWAINPSLSEVSMQMPKQSDGVITTKGVVLIFSKPGTVTDLYPSADPQVQNTGSP